MGLFGRRRPAEATEAARTMPDSTPCATGTCPENCLTRDFPPREVNVSVTEVISNAPTAYASWNNTYGWQSKYMLTVRRSSCSVLLTMRLKITGPATDDQKTAAKAMWKTKIEGRWNNKVKFVCPDSRCAGACGAGYPVSVEVVYVEASEHYVVTANVPGATEGGRSGVGGTTSMTGWGINDPTDITHEFGHMIGAPEEYFTTNGIDYTHGDPHIRGFRDPGGGNMNNPANDPRPPNYDLIRQQAMIIIGGGTTCTTEALVAAPAAPATPAPATTPPAGTPAPATPAGTTAPAAPRPATPAPAAPAAPRPAAPAAPAAPRPAAPATTPPATTPPRRRTP